MSKLNLRMVLTGAGTLALVPGLASATIIVNNVNSGFTTNFNASIAGDQLSFSRSFVLGPSDLYATYEGSQPSYYSYQSVLQGSGLSFTPTPFAAGAAVKPGVAFTGYENALTATWDGSEVWNSQFHCFAYDAKGDCIDGSEVYYTTVSYSGPYAGGPLLNTGTSYLGLALDIGGQTHYGWAEFAVDGTGGSDLNLNLIADAYETTPNRAIAAGALSDPTGIPEPGTLALLAAGMAGLALLRRRRLPG